MAAITKVWASEQSVRRLRLALLKRNGSTTGITEQVSEALNLRARQIESEGVR